MSRSLSIRVFLIFFLGGVGLGPLLNWWFIFFGFLAAGGILFLLSVNMWRKFRPVIFIGSVGFLFGITRFLLAVPNFSAQDIAFYRGLPFEVTISGTITDDPFQKNGSVYAVMEVDELIIQAKPHIVYGKVQLKLPRYPAYQYGDRLKIMGLLEKPFFENGDVYAFMGRPKVVSYSPGTDGTFDILWFVFRLKNFLMERLEQLFTEPDASMAAGVLLGARSGIPSALLADFNKVGLTHILAISGYNITLIIELLALSLKAVPRMIRFFVTISLLLLFVLLTGFSASVIRAALMGGLSLSASLFYRRSQGLQILLLSGCIMVLIDPFLLPFDISFQLSFMATLGLLLFMPFFEKLQGFWLKVPSLVKEGLLVTVAAQLLTIPITLYYFGKLSLISFLSNVVLLPIIPFLMFFSFIALLCSLLFLWPLALVAVSIYWLWMRLLLGGVTLFASVPFASLEISFFPWWLALLYYFLMGILVFLVHPNRR